MGFSTSKLPSEETFEKLVEIFSRNLPPCGSAICRNMEKKYVLNGIRTVDSNVNFLPYKSTPLIRPFAGL
jgi:hypothetical protein